MKGDGVKAIKEVKVEDGTHGGIQFEESVNVGGGGGGVNSKVEATIDGNAKLASREQVGSEDVREHSGDDGSRDFLDGVPFLEPFSIIPAIAAVTDKLEFSTSVYKLAPRQAVTTAKFVTTLGVMTNNRFHFGVGVSPWYEDFLATGERWEKRGKRMDEQIDILKGLMNGEYFSYKGEFYEIPELKLCPAPTKPLPILIGGHSKLALKRAARVGDGWISAGLSLEETKTLIDQINEYRDEFGTLDHPKQIR